MIGILASSLLTGKVMQVSELKSVKEVPVQNDEEDVTDADETTIGLASSWG